MCSFGTCSCRSATTVSATLYRSTFGYAGSANRCSVVFATVTSALTSRYTGSVTDFASVSHTSVTLRERTIRMSHCVISARYTAVQLMITVVVMMSRTERAPVVMTMECVAVLPVPVVRPATVYVPPTRVISPVPRRMPAIP